MYVEVGSMLLGQKMLSVSVLILDQITTQGHRQQAVPKYGGDEEVNSYNAG